MSSATAQDTADYKAELRQTQVDLRPKIKILIEKIESESIEKLHDGAPQNFPNCRRIDLAEYKAVVYTFKPKYEQAVNSCLDLHTPFASVLWQGLDNDSYSFETRLRLFNHILNDREESSPEHSWLNEILANYKAGESHLRTIRNAFESCIRWADLDADLVMSSEAAPVVIDDFNRDIDRGSVICVDK